MVRKFEKLNISLPLHTDIKQQLIPWQRTKNVKNKKLDYEKFFNHFFMEFDISTELHRSFSKND